MEIQKPFKAQKHTISAVGAVLVQEGKLVAAAVAVVARCLARSVSVSDSCELTVGVIQ